MDEEKSPLQEVFEYTKSLSNLVKVQKSMIDNTNKRIDNLERLVIDAKSIIDDLSNKE